jgi:hypothetical protein
MMNKKIPTDPNDPYFFKNCFVCQEVARPDQVRYRNNLAL